MTSDLRQCLEWCTELPTVFSSRESPLFSLKGTECFFKFSTTFGWKRCYEVSLELKDKHADLESCCVHFQVGFKSEDTSDVHEGEFKASKQVIVWRMPVEELQSKLPLDFVAGDLIKFLFHFDKASEFVLKSKETETEPEAVTENDVDQELQKSPETTGNNIHFEALSRDFLKLLEESSNSDVEITCEGRTFKAHRNILGARSTVFAAMLKSDMVEGKTGLIKVEDMKSSTFESFLRYLYSGTFPELNIDIAKQLFEAGDQYAVEELKKGCSEFLTQNLSESNASEILVLADNHSDGDFRSIVISYIIDEKIPQRDRHWSNFSDSHPLLALEVANRYIQKFCLE